MNSSAVCEREDCPGPSFTDCHDINAWSLNVGDPNDTAPINSNLLIMGCSRDIDDGLRRVERGVSSH